MNQPLHGRTIAITGASKGIGYALARDLTASGATVIAGARDITGLDLPGVTFLTLDVTSEPSVDAFTAVAAQAGVDALINNAGVGAFMPVEDITPEVYHRVMDTNVLGTILTTRALIPHFRTRGGGQVINVTSDVSARTFANGALYTASKYAQRAVTHALAHEGHAYGLRVTEIRPGMVDTHFGDTEQGAEYKAAWLKPEDIVQAVTYALTAPAHVRVDEVLLHPVIQDVAY
ncbi:SDR family oxidoreductase [Deinococcus maricopensis]|uniref:Short-chain dehydrogenase/reductase SDR n=1 Tax=Deinococcus maricopensis (strain DSM 21211 / LMG 22137 / NRRL B-23946 / LB-34) TaxID=709986 RepID=E8U8H2_DEIML|nr:SDR family oxidoreductase [Deinococcus maricopensis]ADV67361.1 short-chain dehydrogenase/reductase SDR [Deinococcus maricopensis DSM 21211]